MPLEDVLARLRDGELEIGAAPADAGGWSVAEKSRLVESLLIRIPMPAVYVDAGDEARWVVIDGRRRLAALGEFMIDKSYRLSGLDYLIELDGDGYDDLARAQKRRIGETQITLEIVKPGTPAEIRRNIFRRVNPRWSPQAVREAVADGAGTDLVRSLAEGEAFRAATGIESPSTTDREAVLRFLALFPTAHPPTLDRPVDDTLTAALDSLNEQSLEGMLRRHQLAQRFDAAMALLSALFEGRACRAPDAEGPIDQALFETWSVILARLDSREGERLLARREEVIKAFTELLHDQAVAATVAPGIDDPASVAARHAAVHDLVEQFVSA